MIIPGRLAWGNFGSHDLGDFGSRPGGILDHTTWGEFVSHGLGGVWITQPGGDFGSHRLGGFWDHDLGDLGSHDLGGV